MFVLKYCCGGEYNYQDPMDALKALCEDLVLLGVTQEEATEAWNEAKQLYERTKVITGLADLVLAMTRPQCPSRKHDSLHADIFYRSRAG